MQRTPSSLRAPALLVLAVTAASVGLVAPAARAQAAAGAPRDLRVELRSAPDAIDVARPRLSWELDDAWRGAAQTAYRVLVASNLPLLAGEESDVWDSGQVTSADTCQVEYAGKPLQEGRTYYWVVRAWDAQGQPSPWSAPAEFTAAAAAGSAWDARWIRAGRAPDDSTIGWHTAYQQHEDDWQWIQFDFGANVYCDKVVLHPARPDGDASKPGALFPLRVRLYTDATGKFDGSKFIRIGEYEWQDIPNAGEGPFEVTVPRYNLRYLRVVVTKMARDGERGYAAALGEIEVVDQGQNIAPRGQVTAGSTLEAPGWSPAAINDGVLLPTEKERSGAPDSLPRLLGVCTIDSQPARARLRATALGLYDVWVNGTRLEGRRLQPGWTDYTRRVTYQTYDVTQLVKPGPNVVAVQLAPGWYAGRLGLAGVLGDGRERGFYGEEPRFLAQLDITLDNGKRIQLATGPVWRWSRGGPVLSADLLDGETDDLTLQDDAWSFPNYPAVGWRPVEVVEGPAPTVIAERAEPTREVREHAALSVREVAPKTFVFDFGQNLVGVVRARVAGARGDVVTLRHGEVLDADGTLYTANLRGAAQTDRFTLRAGAQTIEPRFTVHGFRFVELSGLPRAPELSDVVAVEVGPGIADTASFECSDPILNAVWRNTGASLRSNLVSIPTDCPQRDERLGWMGDALIIAPTALLRLDVANQLAGWLGEVRGAQAPDGRFPDFAPHPFDPSKRFSGAPGWADAGVLVPWAHYLATHDLRQLRTNVGPALAWLRFVTSKNPDLVWRKERGNDYGDWLNGSTITAEGWSCDGCDVPKDLFATAFLARTAEVAAKMAFATQTESDAADVAARTREAFHTAFVQKDGRLAGDTQAGYALALDFGLYDSPGEAQAWADRLAQRIREQKALTCGFQTAHRALLALSRFGYHALAVELATRKTLPSWGFMVENGATTMWERWDGFVPGRGFADPGMNSFNHYAFGAICEWMVRAVAGIEQDDGHPTSGPVTLFPQPDGTTRSSAEGPWPWQHFRLEPRVDGPLTWARAEHDSIAGRITSAWKLDGKTLEYECTVPPNTTATLVLPVKSDSVTEGGAPLKDAKGVVKLPDDGATTRLELSAGLYAFRGTRP